MKVTVSRKASFNAAHRLYNKSWTDDKNAFVFGKCNNANFHGHNYDMVVCVTGDIIPETGYVIDMKYLKRLIDEEVIERFDHKNLNLDTEEFHDLTPTAENIAVIIYDLLRKKIDRDKKVKIILYETERNFVEYGE